MHLKGIFIISCLILSTYAKSWSSGGLRRSSSSSNRRSSSSFGGPPSLKFPPPRRPNHTPHIPSAPPLPSIPKIASRIPPPPPPPRNNFGSSASAPNPSSTKTNVGLSKGAPLKPIAAATASRTNVMPLSTAALLGPGLIRMRKNNSTSNGNSNSFGTNGARNNTTQAKPSLFPTGNNTTNHLNIGNTFSKESAFNKTSFPSFSKNVTKTGFQLGSAENGTDHPVGGVKNVLLPKRNQTLTGNGVIQVISPRRNITQNFNGNVFPKVALVNGTRFNNTVSATGNASVNATGLAQHGNVRFNATSVRFNATGVVQAVTTSNNTVNATGNARVNATGLAQHGNVRFNATSVRFNATGVVQAASTSLNIGNINKNSPPVDEQMPWNANSGQVPSTQTNNGLDNNQGTDSKSKKSPLKDIAKDILKKAVKKFGSKDKVVKKKASHAVSTSLGGRATNEYAWKSSLENIPPKPPTTIMRNQIIIIAICITILLLAAGILVYFCNRK